MTSINPATVSVVVIAYNDAGLVGEAVSSALDQGPVVDEIIAVNDASSDDTGRVLDELAARHPRLKVLHRTENSGGCGTPRNDGIAAATAPYVLFLDSDDVLPPGAADALVRAAERHRAPVTVGACVRRELPQHQDVPWVPGLYTPGDVIERPADRPELVRDTLCVNKLYARAFLDEHDIRFPDGRFVYEDFVFTARVLAAAPRVAVIDDLVYVWHVRRSAAQVSISLDREDVANWLSRIEAHRTAARTLAAASPALGHACQVKFLEYDLRMYLRELGDDPDYQAAWWTATRDYLDGFTDAVVEAAGAHARWIVRLLRATPKPPADVERLTRFAAEPRGCCRRTRAPRTGCPCGARSSPWSWTAWRRCRPGNSPSPSTPARAEPRACGSASTTCTDGSPPPGRAPRGWTSRRARAGNRSSANPWS